VQTAVSAPASVTATATATNSVTVSWSAVTGADSYVLYRTDRGLVGTTTATSLVDSSVVGSTAYLYYVHAKIGTSESGDSPKDLATTVMFTDDPQLKILATDITTLRAAVNAVRARAGLGAYAFTDTDASLHGLAVKGIHIQQLRDVLNNARGLLGLAAWSFTDPNVDPATNGGQHIRIKHVHVTDLRGGVQ
jgi:fibronectin type 3 domain-containing protein